MGAIIFVSLNFKNSLFKIFILLFVLTGFSEKTYSQGFEGNWSGKYYNTTIDKFCQIILNFKWNKDSSYDVISISEILLNNGDTIIAKSKMDFKIKDYESIALTETNLFESNNKQDMLACYQQFVLKIKVFKEEYFLDGLWHFLDPKCGDGGSITFKKQT